MHPSFWYIRRRSPATTTKTRPSKNIHLIVRAVSRSGCILLKCKAWNVILISCKFNSSRRSGRRGNKRFYEILTNSVGAIHPPRGLQTCFYMNRALSSGRSCVLCRTSTSGHNPWDLGTWHHKQTDSDPNDLGLERKRTGEHVMQSFG